MHCARSQAELSGSSRSAWDGMAWHGMAANKEYCMPQRQPALRPGGGLLHTVRKVEAGRAEQVQQQRVALDDEVVDAAQVVLQQNWRRVTGGRACGAALHGKAGPTHCQAMRLHVM